MAVLLNNPKDFELPMISNDETDADIITGIIEACYLGIAERETTDNAILEFKALPNLDVEYGLKGQRTRITVGIRLIAYLKQVVDIRGKNA